MPCLANKAHSIDNKWLVSMATRLGISGIWASAARLATGGGESADQSQFRVSLLFSRSPAYLGHVKSELPGRSGEANLSPCLLRVSQKRRGRFCYCRKYGYAAAAGLDNGPSVSD